MKPLRPVALIALLGGCLLLVGSCTPAGGDAIKHVILISIDTCRADHLSCYGYSRNTTPHIDGVAREGILFSRAQSPVPLTLPSHSSMLTGLTPLSHQVRDNGSYLLRPEFVTLQELLRDRGFMTGAVTGSAVLDSKFGLAQGFAQYDDEVDAGEESHPARSERGAGEVSDLALQWLERNREGRSFLFLHYFDPHDPYEMHEDFPFASLEQPPSKEDRYDSELAFTDHHIGRVIAALKEMGLYESTLLVITADHGEGLGNHGENDHGYFVYQTTLHVPLIMKIPGGARGKVIREPVGLVDILPTVAGALGTELPGEVDGVDLRRSIAGSERADGERFIYSESLTPTKFGFAPLLALAAGRWKYIYGTQPELYDLAADPGESHDLSMKQASRAGSLHERLLQLLEEKRTGAGGDYRRAMDRETVERLESLGYVAGRAVDENLVFDSPAPDPRDFIEVYHFFCYFLSLMESSRMKEAKKPAEEALEKFPYLDILHFVLGAAAVEEGDGDAVLRHLLYFVESAQGKVSSEHTRMNMRRELGFAHNSIGKIFHERKEAEQAIRHYELALENIPEAGGIYFNLGNLHFDGREYQNAIGYYEKFLETEPDHVEALNSLAWLYAVLQETDLHRPARAVALASRASRLESDRHPRYLDTLAVGYAASGDYEAAVRTAEKALEIARSDRQWLELSAKISARIALFKAGQPYREPL